MVRASRPVSRTSVNITQRWSEMSEQRCVKKNAGPKGSDQRLCYLTSVQVYRTSVKVKQTLVRLLGLTFGNTNAGQPTPDQRFSSRHGLHLTVRPRWLVSPACVSSERFFLQPFRGAAPEKSEKSSCPEPQEATPLQPFWPRKCQNAALYYSRSTVLDMAPRT